MFLAVALAALVAFPACGGDDKAGLVGTWELHLPSAIKGSGEFFKSKVAEMPEEQREMAQGMFDNMLKAMEASSGTVVVNADGTWTSTIRMPDFPSLELTDTKEAGTWKLDGDKVTVTATTEDGKKLDKPKVRTGTLKGDELRTREDDQPFDTVMHRKK